MLVSLSLSGLTNILPWLLSRSVCVCLDACAFCMHVCAVYAPFITAILPFFSISPSVPSQRCFCTPLNYATSAEWSGKKRESGNFIIITSHFCNLYAMRTLRACSYNQVCRNHVRCFTNSWGDGSSSAGYGFPCC